MRLKAEHSPLILFIFLVSMFLLPMCFLWGLPFPVCVFEIEKIRLGAAALGTRAGVGTI